MRQVFKFDCSCALCEVFLKNQLYKFSDSPFAALFGKLYDVWNFRDFFYGVGGAGFKPDGGQKLEIVYVVPDVGDFAEAYADFPAKFRNCFDFGAFALKQIVDFKLFCPAAYNFGIFGSMIAVFTPFAWMSFMPIPSRVLNFLNSSPFAQ